MKILSVPLTNSFSLEAGSFGRQGEAIVILPPPVAMFDQLSGWLCRQAPPDPSGFSTATIGIGATALCLRCSKSHAEHLLAFSCRQRGICGSCQAKRAALFAEKLTADILAPVPHRHWTFSIPRFLRGLVERDRKLLGLLSQTACASILKTFQTLLDRKDVRPGCVIALQTFGAYAGNWNPHAHAIVSIITQPRIVDRILRHFRSDHCQARDPFEPRPPPCAGALSLQ